MLFDHGVKKITASIISSPHKELKEKRSNKTNLVSLFTAFYFCLFFVCVVYAPCTIHIYLYLEHYVRTFIIILLA